MPIEDLSWIITRIDGKIASVSTDWSGAGKTASVMASWHPDRASDVHSTKISTAELFALSENVSWDGLLPLGTDFQRRVWKKLFSLTHNEEAIPLGAWSPSRLYSYTEFAEICGNRAGVRAVAHAVGLNPLPVIVPCHLIIPKETSDRIREIEKEAEGTLFGKDGLCLDMSLDFGQFSCPGGKDLKRSLIVRSFFVE